MSDRRPPAGLNRRNFLRQAMWSAGAASAVTCLPRFLRPAAAAVPPNAVFPTIFIQLRGGWDPCYHFAARTGFASRAVAAADIRQTAAGVRWHVPTMTAMTPHMEDAVILRNVRMSPNIDHHTGLVELWYGTASNPTSRPPWTNVLASALLKRSPAAAPNVTSYWKREYSASDRDTDYVRYHNTSPDPLGAAQRILNIGAFASSLDTTMGLPPPAEQQAVYDAISKSDARLYDPSVQPSTVAQFGQANAQANDLLGRTVGAVWPPDMATRTMFNLTTADLTRTGYQATPHLLPMTALAFQLARYQASHVISMTAADLYSYDNHGGGSPTTFQRTTGTRYFDMIARLLSALKATPSPLDPSISMFETTHVVIASEMGRSPNAEMGNGTFHWDSTHVACFGGRFKRGYGYGDLDGRLMAMPADFDTGALNQGTTTSWMNVVATILKANGVDPSTYSTAKPINAVLRP
ncbi:MAG: DUF1501 domain-containing protein [Deltaproteobacteria bacterium]|nr:DUF1501 domain-containing protein [Deltaproteobacteria bacterium]MDQ3295861.1 DUF1501 domain-containing protein [Myxococcota bacterium]